MWFNSRHEGHAVQWWGYCLGCLHPMHPDLSLSYSAPNSTSCWCIFCETAGDGSSLWVPDTHVGDPEGVKGSWFLLCPLLALVGICGSEPLNGTSLSLCFQIKKKLKKKVKNMQKKKKSVSSSNSHRNPLQDPQTSSHAHIHAVGTGLGKF